MPPHLVQELQKWSVHYPALAGVARDAAPPPVPEVHEHSESELDRLAAAEQTVLAKKCEAATEKGRLAHQEVQWRLDRFNKAKATMEEMQRNHVEAEQQLEVARKATREADTAKSAFDVVAYKTAKGEGMDADTVPWLRGMLVDYTYVEAHPHEFTDDDLSKLVQYSGILLPQWQQHRLHLQRMRSPAADDAASDMGSEVGEGDLEQGERDQLRELKKRAADTGLDENAAKEYADLIQKRILAKSTKRARISQSVTCDMYRAFCNATAKQMGQHGAGFAPPGGAAGGGAAASEAQPSV
ncbi:unnamed protein product [Prorocentrum cordatum]|uniref:Uncharacterized protein n=1 Tax=Prorocentrum cordatum TaxID=2364126 RepID=A0ABN9VLL6_9DINO|nr:unnamed protein product [Polarella glacialis]